MPIQHTVVFALIHEPGSPAEQDFLEAGRRTLTAVPGVTHFMINEQVSPKSDLGWQFSMIFADRDAYEAYNDHPEHVGFVQRRWLPEVREFQEYDFVAR